jgi:protein-tyrosine-phosphatase
MAEAFARAYGSDVLTSASAGFAPAASIPNQTIRAMAEKNLDLSAHFPKSMSDLQDARFDLVVNMSGFPIGPINGAMAVREWSVPDPITMDYKNHCKVRDRIENLVMALILELRQGAKRAAVSAGGGVSEVSPSGSGPAGR